MATTIEEIVLNAGDTVQQLAAAVKGSKRLKDMADERREEATAQVEAYLRSNSDGLTFAHKGPLNWKGTDIIVKHQTTYTWDNYRKSQIPEEKKTDKDRELEEKVQMALDLRLFRKQLLDSAQDAANVANASLKAAKTNFKAAETALAELLPDSKCIHDKLQIAIE